MGPGELAVSRRAPGKRQRCRLGLAVTAQRARTILATRLAFGPTFVEPIGFAMDRRMLLGVKERAESKRDAA